MLQKRQEIYSRFSQKPIPHAQLIVKGNNDDSKMEIKFFQIKKKWRSSFGKGKVTVFHFFLFEPFI